jgi:hypothetical protein
LCLNVTFSVAPERMITATPSISLSLTTKIKVN